MERLQEVKEQVVEIRAMQAMEMRRSQWLRETQEQQEEDVRGLPLRLLKPLPANRYHELFRNYFCGPLS
jgi:hypothetical protein